MNRHVSGVEEEYHSAVSRSQNASIKVEEGTKFLNFVPVKNLPSLKERKKDFFALLFDLEKYERVGQI